MLNHCDAAIAGRNGDGVQHSPSAPGRISLLRVLAALGRAPLRLHGYRDLRVRAVENLLGRRDGC